MTPETYPAPSWIGLVWAAVPVLALVVLLAVRRLGQVSALVIAAIRMAGQLMLLGLVLAFVFESDHPGIVGLVALVMLSASAQAVGARQERPSWTIRLEGFAAMAVSAGLALAVSTRLALGVEPWYESSVVVPLMGMILGNSVNGVALAADRYDSELRSTADLIERRLALGASSRQASRPALRVAVRAGLTPILNSMTIAGLVAIPGLMTGQLLAGVDPRSALRYQVMTYLAIATASGFGVLALLGLRARHAFTADHQLRRDFLRGDQHPS